LVEQLIRNQQVIGSSPIAGSTMLREFADLNHPLVSDSHLTAKLTA
jgi:hypothetical protein